MAKRKKPTPAFYIPSTNSIDPDVDTIDSRDVIERIDDLLNADDEHPLRPDDAQELDNLQKLVEDAGHAPDWRYGETLIAESYFTDYIQELIHSCYELPEDLDSGRWPWNHMKFDYEAAAAEAKQDYTEVTYAGRTFYIRE